MAWLAITGPKDAGASEREQMLQMANDAFADAGVESPTRVDVPGRGGGTADDGTALRDQVHAIVPALQSGSLFGGANGLLVMDSQNLLKAEVDVVVEMLGHADELQVVAVFASSGAMAAALKKAVSVHGKAVTIKQSSSRDSNAWIVQYARDKGLRIDGDARVELVKSFGGNIAAMRRAVDQLAISGGVINAGDIRDRFDNRPDEPMWFLGDAIMSGDHEQALLRLSAFLVHNHPLVLLSYLEGEVRKRSLAAIAPDYETFADWAGGNPKSFATKKIWERRTRANGQALANCVRALAKADITLKTQPEATHRVTLERLTVAMSLWMSR
jgi:DNA polymerase III delta subunit